MNNDPAVSDRMREDWNQRAREDPHYYVAFGSRDQDEEGFLATAGDVLRSLETELKRFPKDANRRAWRALEIGCGPGRLMKPMSKNFGEIHGVDVSDEMIRLAGERLRDIPHAHVHATNGASLGLFADESFDFVYSYAVFQHIPSRDVVLEYMREAKRVLKSGGIFKGQFNGLPHAAIPDTWSGVVLSAADIRAFTRENNFQLLSLEGVDTQYMWTAWRKKSFPQPTTHTPQPAIRRVTHAYSFEPVSPNRARHAAISVWMENLPDECDLNNLNVDIDGATAEPFFIGWPIAEGIRQVNVWLPKGVRTGLLPVELQMNGTRLCAPGTVRVIPAGPQVPRIVSITDGVNLVQKNASSSGILKVQLEEVGAPESLTATIADQPVERLEIKCIDPRAPRHEVNLRLPEGLAPGHYRLQIRVGHWRLPAEIDVLG
ncbi:MAG TPA: methyltransferase domain-containing protein [Bryobacteraceae bacterium]|nr:methyltransferase domain-containing protein [Bryobacteraceae bacterium]